MTVVTGLADELLDAVNARDPLLATLDGFRDRDHLLGDFSEAGEAAASSRLDGIVRRARAIDPASLPAADRLTRTVILAYGRAQLDRLAARGVEYTITPLYVAPAAELLFGLPMVGIVTSEHADGYLSRLRRVPGLLVTVAERHRGGVAAGRLPVRRLVEGAVAHVDRYLANRDADPLRRPAPPPDGAAGAAAFPAERDRLIDAVVRPAFARYRDVLADEIADHGRPDERVGLCWLPDGGDVYERLVRAHTTTARSAEELHHAGLELIERLTDEYRRVGGRVFGPIGQADLFERLRTDPALRWRDAGEVLAAARAAIDRAERVAPRWFGRLPRERCAVEPVPADEAPAAPVGNYLPAAMDGSRPAIYFANTDRAHERDRYSAEVVAFHEAVPGHHVQVALARELPDLPALRRSVAFDAFAEGWGLYAERLADEMGLYSDDVARLGMLAADSVRAARLVVDTGIHAFGWSRAKVTSFLRTQTPMADGEIERETDRYIADPGQALAYMVGRLEFERLRSSARGALAERFDIRAFHDVVLRNGELPLEALAGVVVDWLGGRGDDRRVEGAAG